MRGDRPLLHRRFPHILLASAKETCPHCAEPIKGGATVCKHCGRDL
ncbi:MAG: hypothetical protein BRD41_03330 [Bacteroidetes bacterium QS_1_63_11]|nr:MAG: hypothetical protein BRD41_03330 [Bacteroidetes bacterium QS_1_63_11]